MKMRISLYSFSLLIGSLISFQSHAEITKEVTIGFDGLPDLALDLGELGVIFTGAQVLACGSSLNCPEFPPSSGLNVIFDRPGSDTPGLITAKFVAEDTGIVTKVSARITGNTNITMTAYSGDGLVLGTTETGGPNYVSANLGIPPNKLLSLVSDGESIASVTFSDSGNTFTVDDFSFSSTASTVILDPGHGLIEKNDGTFAYQRDATSTYSIVEDKVALSMAIATQGNLEENGVKVLKTRNDEKAPFAPKGCGVPCLIDTKKRAEWVDKQEADLMVSIHTNAGVPKAHGTETFVRSSASAKESDLAAKINAQLVSSGLRDRGVKKETRSNVQGAVVTNVLTEVAFHSNSELAEGQTLTDEERLYSDSGILASLIAAGISGYLDEQE